MCLRERGWHGRGNYFSHLRRFTVELGLNFFLEFNQPQEGVDSQAH